MDPPEVADRIELEVMRRLGWYGATDPLDRAAVLAVLSDRVARQRDRAIVTAADDPAIRRPYALLSPVMGISRQAVRQRVERLRSAEQAPLRS